MVLKLINIKHQEREEREACVKSKRKVAHGFLLRRNMFCLYIYPAPFLFPLILTILLRSQLVPSLCSASDASSTKALNYALKVFLHEESQYPLLNYCWYAFNFSFSLSHTHKHIYVCLLLVMYLGIALWLGFFFLS